MAKKFRKVFLIVKDNEIFTKHNYQEVPMYRDRNDADRMCALQQQNANDETVKVYNANNLIPQYKVHSYYLIHEGLF